MQLPCRSGRNTSLLSQIGSWEIVSDGMKPKKLSLSCCICAFLLKLLVLVMNLTTVWTHFPSSTVLGIFAYENITE